MTILVCGEALYDVFQTGADPSGAVTFDARVGGSPFNVAIGIARLGGSAALLTGISNDALGARLFDRLTAEGVGTGHIIRSGRRTTLSMVGLDVHGQPDYAFYGVGSADCALMPADMPDLSPGIGALHFGSYSIAVAPVADALARLAERYRDRFISLDPNVRPSIEPDMGIWRARIDAMRAHANLIKVSAEDLALLYPGRDAGDIACNWLADGAGLVVITDGGAAVRAYRGDTCFKLTPPSVDVVDSVGAGDAFQSSLLADLQARDSLSVTAADLPGEMLAELIGAAARAAAVACTRRGADLPSRADLDACPFGSLLF